MEHDQFPGCALAVVKDGHILRARLCMANLELSVAITPQSVFDIGSVSKDHALAILLLFKTARYPSMRHPKYLPEMPDYGRRSLFVTCCTTPVGSATTTIYLILRNTEADLTTDRDAMELIVRQRGELQGGQNSSTVIPIISMSRL